MKDNGLVSGNMLLDNSTTNIYGISVRNYDNSRELINVTTNKKARIKLFVTGQNVRLTLNSGKSLTDEYGNILYTNGLSIDIPVNINGWIEFPVDLPIGIHTISLNQTCSSGCTASHNITIKEIDII